MQQPTAAQPATTESGGSGLSLRGLVQVFYAPGEFFAQLRERPRVLVPWLAIIIGMFLFGLATWQYSARISIEFMQSLVDKGVIPASQIPPLETLKWRTIGGNVINPLLAPLLIGGLAILIGNFIMGGSARFKQILAVTLYAEFLYTVGNLIHIPLIYAADSMTASLSLAAILSDPNVTSPLFHVLARISVFYIWEIIVFGIGLSAVYGFSRNKGYVLSVLSIGIPSLIFIAYMALMGSIGG
jgi:hypothetical protein